ncbi:MULTISPECIES: hypothetical protein [Sphingobacterium]|uniref:hypothetical protein n=1 Tax=Sphingobacterium TaxID=28453 RepID=UPI00104EA573|nr:MULTISPECIES: hypothetical protein [Sphingobacterium]MCS3555122.1 hypothetical protein [Sphingobacterium sp. JUb21]MCW2261461.1 hypothetical protein [Sphingobacterium kitahiroshimense]TCR09772.1 hypothetical protein EDF67_10540 [Sphingobacterium sp. JUb78]
MMGLKITTFDWITAKEKIKRKYNHLSDEDLVFEENQEEKLINHLMAKLHRDREYVLFTLAKSLSSIESNRL